MGRDNTLPAMPQFNDFDGAVDHVLAAYSQWMRDNERDWPSQWLTWAISQGLY